MKCENLPGVCRELWNALKDASDSLVHIPCCRLPVTNLDWPSWQISELLGFLPFALTGCTQRLLTNFGVNQTK